MYRLAPVLIANFNDAFDDAGRVALVALAFKRLRVASSASLTKVQKCLLDVFAEHKFESRIKSDPFWAVGEAIYVGKESLQ